MDPTPFDQLVALFARPASRRGTIAALLSGALARKQPVAAAADCPSTCPHGCCDASGTCQAGNTIHACGTGGVACMACALGQACDGARCLTVGDCFPTNCPNGCCQGTTCVTATSDAQCGANGSACVACQGKKHCKNGVCKKKHRH
jgi:hypothetical protein